MDNMDLAHKEAAKILREINMFPDSQMNEFVAAAIIEALTSKLTRCPGSHIDHIIDAVESLDWAHEQLTSPKEI
jgi:hypothetical protein